MTIHPNITPDPTTTPPGVYVEKLSFRYRSLDVEPQQKRQRSAQVVEAIEPLQAIEEISFSLPAGKLMLRAGPSGCGKSTVLKCLNGLIPHSYKGKLSFFTITLLNILGNFYTQGPLHVLHTQGIPAFLL